MWLKQTESPEYVAFEQCGPEQVLVASSVGPWDSVGGDIKFLRLRQRNVAGLVTDGSVRDTSALLDYGFPVYSHSTTAKQGPAAMQPWAVNDVVNLNGTTVRPGDLIVGDQDGVVVVPRSMAASCVTIAQEREEVEDAIKDELQQNPDSPGKYYPFRKPVQRSSPLGQLLSSRGIAHHFDQPNRQLTTSPTRRRLVSSATASVPTEMNGIVVNQPGGLEALELERLPVPSGLADGEVLVQNAHAGVNFIDTYHRSGLYARELPFVLGQEAAGIVATSTPSAEAAGFGVGAPVAYSVLGTYCEYTKVPHDKLLSVDNGVPLDQAVTVPVQGLTAHYLVNDAHIGLVQRGDWMLVHAAAGGTGQFAVQLAKRAGYRVIGTCSTSKIPLAKEIGCDVVIDYSTEESVASAVMEATDGNGCAAVLDGVGAKTYKESLGALGRRGICVFFGNASGPVPPIAPLELVGKSAYITRPKLNDYTVTREELVARADDVFAAINSGEVKVAIDQRFKLADAEKAHAYIEAGKSIGKIILDTE